MRIKGIFERTALFHQLFLLNFTQLFNIITFLYITRSYFITNRRLKKEEILLYNAQQTTNLNCLLYFIISIKSSLTFALAFEYIVHMLILALDYRVWQLPIINTSIKRQISLSLHFTECKWRVNKYFTKFLLRNGSIGIYMLGMQFLSINLSDYFLPFSAKTSFIKYRL